jgi:ubiquinone/menaquinone biosynthesis C-methylase UbiE
MPLRAGTASISTAAFDDLAPTYDASFTATRLGGCLRALVWARLDEAFAGCRRVLEIGCGTGEDAVHLARRGAAVVATDPSQPMLDVAARKATESGCAERIRFVRAPFERLGAELAGETFDGVFSNFGAVNCVLRLEAAAAGIARLLAPGAPLLFVVMGRHVPWEWGWFLARGDWRKAFRRVRGPTPWRGLELSYPTPGELARRLAPWFVPAGRHPLGVVLPPTYASSWLERTPRGFATLAALEKRLNGCAALAGVADHYLFAARTASRGAGG